MTVDFPLPRTTQHTLFSARSENGQTQAALVAATWCEHRDPSKPGITIKSDVARKHTHLSRGQVTPLFEVRAVKKNITAFIAADRSALVAREVDGILTVLPHTFRLRKWATMDHPLTVRVRSSKQGEAFVSFQRHQNDTHLEKYHAHDMILTQDPEKKQAIMDIVDDLRPLSALFEDLPYVGIPNGCPPGEAIANGDFGLLGLPPLSEDAEIYCPNWLPQKWYTDEERKAAEAWGADVIAWLHDIYPDLERGEANMIMAKPYDRTGGQIYFTLIHPNRIPHGFSISWADLEEQAEACPLPPDRRVCLNFRVTDRKRKHASTAPRLRLARLGTPVSRHKILELRNRFGDLPEKLARKFENN